MQGPLDVSSDVPVHDNLERTQIESVPSADYPKQMQRICVTRLHRLDQAADTTQLAQERQLSEIVVALRTAHNPRKKMQDASQGLGVMERRTQILMADYFLVLSASCTSIHVLVLQAYVHATQKFPNRLRYIYLVNKIVFDTIQSVDAVYSRKSHNAPLSPKLKVEAHAKRT